MTATDAVFTAIGILVVLALCGFVLLPLLRPTQGRLSPTPAASESAEAERYRLYKQVLEMEFDWRTGKLAREDFDALSAPLLAEAARLLTDSPVAMDDVDEQIEREIAAARRTFGALLSPGLTESAAG